MKLRICNKGVWCIANPAPDITPQEAANFALFLTLACNRLGAGTLEDREAFLEKHNLWRHFTPEEV
jgi:hypothetical protein